MKQLIHSPEGARRFLRMFAELLALAAGGLAVVKGWVRGPVLTHGEAWEDECADCERYF